jgi:hypothetical protein
MTDQRQTESLKTPGSVFPHPAFPGDGKCKVLVAYLPGRGLPQKMNVPLFTEVMMSIAPS